MNQAFGRAADRAAAWAGSPWFFLANVALVAGYLVYGVATGFSEGLNLVVTTFLTVTTQLLVILIQATQNREGRASQVKLDALIHGLDGVSDRLIGLERRTVAEIEAEEARLSPDQPNDHGEG